MNVKSPLPSGAVRRIEAANYLAISTRQLDRLAESGELKRIKIGRASVFRIKELEEFLAKRECAGDVQ